MKTLVEMCKGYGIQGAWTITLSVLTYLVHKKLKKHEEIVEKSKKRQENIEIGLQSLLYFRLTEQAKMYIRQGYITLQAYKDLEYFFTAYSNLGGNGVAKKLYEECKELPIREEMYYE
ncbi:hypothetical protein [Peptostreptococcus anaerobius]|uniref:hypothetical protein n=1 Tax=Peptostreptococcus anaerobius TaxID=1261 RepID=UPI00321A3D62